MDEIKPIFDKNYIPVVFSSDEGYAPYLSVALISLRENASKEHSYDLIVLDGGLSEKTKKTLLDIFLEKTAVRDEGGGEGDKFSFPKELQHLFAHPKTIHHINPSKPWPYKRNSLADCFWKYARQTLFLEEIKKEYAPYLKKYQKENLKNYHKYRWRNLLVFGLNKRWQTKRNHYLQLCHY